MSEQKLQIIKAVRVRKFNTNEDRDSIYDYSIVLIYKDEETGKKFHKIIDDPEFTFYITKEEKEDDYPEYVDVIPINDVEEIKCCYSDLYKEISMLLNDYSNFKTLKKNKDWAAMKQRYHLDRRIHGSDVDLEDYYIGKHYEKYPLENSNSILTKGYFDIEVYTENYVGFPEAEVADCPIDQIGYFDDIEYTFYGFLLNNPNVKAIKPFKDNKSEIEDFYNMIKKRYKDKYNLDIKIKLEWFDYEYDLIVAFWDRVNTNKPDFLTGWNICNFDIPYILNRLRREIREEFEDITEYGVEDKVKEIICGSDFEKKYRYQYLYKDLKQADFSDKGDYFVATSYTNYVDGMLLFANLRKIFGKRESYELDAIAREELGESKEPLDPENKGITIKNIVSKDYKRYIKYNIHDVMLLFLLEEKNSDIDQLYSVASMTETRIYKCLKKTICLKNLSRRFNRQQGFISSNNHNADYTNEKSRSTKSFRGAFVADPNLIDNVGMKIDGDKLSQFLHEHVIDFDLSALYPSITLAFNISPSTYYGKVFYCKEDGTSDKDINKGADLFDRINSRDYINIAKDEFNLPSPIDIIDEIYKEREENNG